MLMDLNKNYIVEANAGSGKTTCIVNRIIQMLENGYEPKRICVVTYTRASARDLRKKIEERLGRQNVYALKEMFVGTIDSLCLQLIDRFGYEWDVNSMALLDDSGSIFYRNAFAYIKQKIETGEDLELREKLQDYLIVNSDPERIFEEGMKLLLEYPDVQFQYDQKHARPKEKVGEWMDYYFPIGNGPWHSKWYQYINRYLREVAWINVSNEVALSGKIYGDTENRLKRYQEKVDIARKWSTGEESSEAFSGLCEDWWKNLEHNCEILEFVATLVPDSVGNSPEQFLESVNREFPAIYKVPDLLNYLKNMQFDVSMDFFYVVMPLVDEFKKLQGKESFTDRRYKVRNLLKENEAIKKEIYNQSYRYFLIDEFQDVEPVQAEIFFYLSDQGNAYEWAECAPRHGSLFLVGDPKQSIYRFGGVDTSLFARVKEFFESGKGEIVYLSDNHRSIQDLCEYYNKTFSDIFKKDSLSTTYHEIPLEELGTWQKTSTIGGTAVLPFYGYHGKTTREKLFERGDSEALYCYQLISLLDKLMGDDSPYRIVTEDGTSRRVEYEDIMVLTYTNKKLLEIKEELLLNAIPVQLVSDSADGANFEHQDDIDDNDNQEGFGFSSQINKESYLERSDIYDDFESESEELSDEAVGIRLSTVHKSKGLEANIVIIAFGYAINGIPEYYIDWQDPERKGYIFSLGKNVCEDGTYKYKRYLQTKRYMEPYADLEWKKMKEDIIHLQYVAATRARNHLFILDSLYMCYEERGKITGYRSKRSSMWIPLIDAAGSTVWIDEKQRTVLPVKESIWGI